MIRKILLVDDDNILRVALEKHLAAFSDNFSVITAEDGLDALDKLKKFPFSLIVVDPNTPQTEGMRLLAHIRGKYPDLPIIVISAMQTDEMQKLIKSYGVLACLGKPFNAEDLVSLILNRLRQEAAGGIMYDVSPTVFLQLMEMESKTCTIRVFDKISNSGGVLYFIDGRLVDARVGESRGIDAAYRVFGWEMVTLYIQNECSPRDNVINSDLQPIIMKAVGMKDELEAPDEAYDDEEELPTVDLADGLEADASAESTLQRLRAQLLQQAGQDCGLEGCSYDESLHQTMNRLNEIGAGSGLGEFLVGYVSNGQKHDRIIISGQPVPVLAMNPDCDRSRIMETLKNLSPKLLRRD